MPKLRSGPLHRPGIIHPYSVPCVKSELDIDYVPPTQTEIEKGFLVEFRPIAPIERDQQTPKIEFLIPANADHYLDLDDMFIKVVLKVTAKKDNTDVVAGDGTVANTNYAPVNNLIHSIFSKVEMDLQDKNITANGQHYAYRAYIEKLLGTSDMAKKTFLENSGWYHSRDAIQDDSSSVKSAKKLADGGNTICLYDRPHLDMCHQHKLLINGVQVKLAFQVNDPKFYMVWKSDKVNSLSVSFLHVALFVRHVRVSDLIMSKHEAYLNKNFAKYQIARNEIRHCIIPKGVFHHSLTDVVNGQLPKRVLLFMTDNDASSGNEKKNPFRFKHFNVNHLACYVNGEQYPSVAYTPNFGNTSIDEPIREYWELYRGLRQYPRPFIDLSYEQFKNGFTVFVFNLSPDCSDGLDAHLNLIKNGNLRFELKFSAETPNVISVLFFCEFDSLIQIDKDRNVATDY